MLCARLFGQNKFISPGFREIIRFFDVPLFVNLEKY